MGPPKKIYMAWRANNASCIVLKVCGLEATCV